MPQRGGNLNSVYNNLYGGDKNGLYTMGPGGGGNRRNPMIYGKPPSRWPRVVLALVIIVLVIAGIRQFACGGILPHNDQNEQQQEQQADKQASGGNEAKQQEAELGNPDLNGTYQAGVDLTLQVSGLGDCTLGNNDDADDSVSFTKIFSDLNSTNYFFANVKRFLENDQLTICNLEGPLSNEGDRANKDFAFIGPTKYTKILTDGGVEACNLANNHIYDYGVKAYENTKTALEKAKITSFGYDRVSTYEYEGIKVGMYGINVIDDEDGTSSELAKQNIKALQDNGCALIIGYYHWGETGSNTVDPSQVTLAHEAIDAGCDLVLGSHPHVMQGVERYNNRYIAYSLSNFCYGGNDHPKDFDTFIFQQTFTFKDGQLVLDDTTLKNVNIVPCSVSSSSEVNNYQPTPLPKKKVADMVTKLNGYSESLSGSKVTFETKLNDYNCAVLKSVSEASASSSDAGDVGSDDADDASSSSAASAGSASDGDVESESSVTNEDIENE